MSRPPKPAHLRMVEGDLGKRGLPAAIPEPPVVNDETAEPPESLPEVGKAMWRALMPDLKKYIGLSVLDRLVLELLCESYVRARRCRDALDATPDKTEAGTGMVILNTTYKTTGRNGTQHKTRPEYHQLHQEIALINKLMGELGMTPASRVRLKGVAQGALPFETNPLDDLNKRYGVGSFPQAG